MRPKAVNGLGSEVKGEDATSWSEERRGHREERIKAEFG